LYIETMEEILGGLPKVLIDVEGGDNMLYLPLGKYLSRQQSETTQIGALSGAASQNSTTGGDRLRDNRTRELR
ncbi:MAG TPA: protease modulator HflK, partial [Gammaproteobacteria bacterium]|nr:protease modulator HflK [Gammaproteobacteria bacterium]